MLNKLKLSAAGLIVVFILAGFLLLQNTQPPKTYDFVVAKVNNVWKVVESANRNNYTLKVKKNETIIWTAEGTDVNFQFPVNLLDPVGQQDSLTNGVTKSIKAGQKLKLKIKSTAKPGTYEYAAYCVAGKVFAIGGSPPRIIVE